MRLKHLLFLILVLPTVFINNLYCQNRYFVAFCASNQNLGHAFISLGYESPERMMTVHDGTWGMYPKTKIEGVISVFFGSVPGEIRNDFLTNRNQSFHLVVSENEYKKSLEVLNKWKNKDYQLLKSDCLSFIIEVATIFEHQIEIPIRDNFLNLPSYYLSELIRINSN
ncbi:hypothetical protein FUA23_21820 [Neolewinella aurantiaca]|uniref:DUF4105 domain-containing protein n=1 Tax=Neolewinella aurantiaca TaxID=2602767 RepID=A0A5C7FEN1_9BACT|nr:hypothetical protein [Neolewinella aurantiaca]TXF82341.1 hypothetical protein FUA23_21820 [Neolewinella aurantiaca]